MGLPILNFEVPLCEICRHYDADQKCRAFPGGIPDDIYEAWDGHRLSVPGDNGLVFVPQYGWEHYQGRTRDEAEGMAMKG